MDEEFLIGTFETEKKFLRYGSFYPCGKRIKFIFLGLFMFVYSWTEFLSMITVLFVERDNLTKLSETLLFCMTQAAFLFKLVNFLYHNKTMLRIESILKNPILNCLDQFEKNIIEKYMIRVKYLARLFRILCILTVSFYGLFPFIDEDPDHMLPLPGWFPFDVKTHQIELVIAQTCGIAIGAFLNSTLDILPTILITLGSAQFDILKIRLENITSVDTSKSWLVKKAIKKCVIYHTILLKKIFYGFELWQIKPKIDSCKFIAKIFRILCILVVLFYTLVPYLDDKEDLSLPLPGWLPYNTKKYYYPTVIFQVMSVSVSAYNNSSIDVLTCMLITVASAEFNLLKGALKTIDFHPKGHNTKQLIEAKFENCVNHHKEIVK
uniref:Odorant receptor n=1 Tax=Tribolium castaneum TaxID=7070 RepID=C0Z3Q1_TRICA|nr:olfactory receptor 4 [Tribolium castaneum]